MRNNKEGAVTWLQVNNWVPIVVSFVTVALAFGATLSRIAVLETKMDLVLENQKTQIAKYTGVEERYGELALKVRELETRLGK